MKFHVPGRELFVAAIVGAFFGVLGIWLSRHIANWTERLS